LVVAGCFPIELDVKDGKLLIAREEGFFLYDPAAGKVVKVWGTEGGRPAFARFSPGGKDILAVVKSPRGLNEFRFLIAPVGGGQGREIFKAEDTGYASFSPDGAYVAVARVAEKKDPKIDERLPEIHLVGVKDGKARVLLRNAGLLFRWFADSKRLLVFEIDSMDKSRNFHGKLTTLDVMSGKGTPLASAVVTQQMFLDMDRDNKKILFTALRAGKPGDDLKKEAGFGMKLFEVDVSAGAVKGTDRDVRYAVFSPDGKQVLLGSPPEGFVLDKVKLEVTDAGLGKGTVLATDAHAPLSLGGGEGMVFPGWVNEKMVFYFATRSVYGSEGRNLMLMLVGTDGKGRRCVQPQLDLESLKEGT